MCILVSLENQYCSIFSSLTIAESISRKLHFSIWYSPGTQDQISPQSKLAEVKQGLHQRWIWHFIFTELYSRNLIHSQTYFHWTCWNREATIRREVQTKFCHHFMTTSSGSAHLSDVPLPCPIFHRMENIRNHLQRRMRTHLPQHETRHLCLHKKFEKTQEKTQSTQERWPQITVPHKQRPSFCKLEPSLQKPSTSLRLTRPQWPVGWTPLL